MAWCEDQHDGTVAVKIVVLRLLPIEELPLQAGPVEVLANVASSGKPVRREGILVLRALHQMGGAGEPTDGSGMVQVQMRLQYEAHTLRSDVELPQLVETALLFL